MKLSPDIVSATARAAPAAGVDQASLATVSQPDDDDLDLDRYIAGAEPAAQVEEPPPPAAGGNGCPSLEGTFPYIERIGRAVYGDLWVGKMAVELDKHPRQFRRWADGQGKPPEVLYTSARIWALRTAARLLKSVGEDDLAYEVGLVATRAAAEAIKKGAEIHQANLARAAEERAAKASDKP